MLSVSLYFQCKVLGEVCARSMEANRFEGYGLAVERKKHTGAWGYCKILYFEQHLIILNEDFLSSNETF